MKKAFNQTLALLFLLSLSFLSVQAQQLKVTGGNLKVNNSSLVLKDMNLVNDGTFSSTDGNVVFAGTTTNTISGTSSMIFDSLTVNKSSGEVQLEQDAMVATHLELQSDNLNLQANN